MATNAIFTAVPCTLSDGAAFADAVNVDPVSATSSNRYDALLGFTRLGPSPNAPTNAPAFLRGIKPSFVAAETGSPAFTLLPL